MADITVDVSLPNTISADITSPTQALAANISIPGPQGPVGIQGPSGLQGPSGEQGPIGPQGPSGIINTGELDLRYYSINNPSGFITGINLSNYVTTTGNQTISGTKTFNTAPIFNGNPLITGVDLSSYLTSSNAATTYATISNLSSTGNTLDTKINNLSGYINFSGNHLVYTTGNQTITGIKVFNDNIGLAINNPLRKFHQEGGKLLVNSNEGSWGQLQITNPSVGEVSMVLANNATINSNGSLASSQDDYIWNIGLGSYANDANKFIIGNNGYEAVLTVVENKVGIGTVFPSGKLHVAGYSDDVNTPIQIIESAGSQAPCTFRLDNTDQAYVKGDNAGNLALGAQNFIAIEAGGFGGTNEKIRIEAGGNVGIGTSSPTEKLEVNGNILANNLVYNTGNQNISGNKIFTEDLIVQKSGFFWSGIKIGLNSVIITDQNIKISGDPVVVQSTFTGYTGNVVNTYATISNLSSTGSTLQNQINNLGTTYATVSNLQNTGINLDGKINSLSGYVNSQDSSISNNLTSTGTTLVSSINSLTSNLNSTGLTLDTKINSLSGNSVLLYGDQSIGGIKTFRDKVYIDSLYVTGTETILNTTNNNISSPYLLLNLTGGLTDGGIFFVTGSGLTGINDTGVIFGFDNITKTWHFGQGTRLTDISTLDEVMGMHDLTGYSGYANQTFSTINNLASTGSTLQTNINTVSSNLVLTGANLTTNINTVSTNLILTGSRIDSLSGTAVFTTGNQTISGNKIFANDINVSGTGSFNGLNLDNINSLVLSGMNINISGNSTLTIFNPVTISGNQVLTGVTQDNRTVLTTTNQTIAGAKTFSTEIITNLIDGASTTNINASPLIISGGRAYYPQVTGGDVNIVGGVGGARNGTINLLSNTNINGTLNVTGNILLSGKSVLTGVDLTSYLTSSTASSTYATITNLTNTGSTLDTKIDNLSGYINSTSSNIVFTTGNQNISGVKTFTNGTLNISIKPQNSGLEINNGPFIIRSAAGTYGAARVQVLNENGANGFTVINEGLELADFGLQASNGKKINFRMEGRSEYANNNNQEFQVIDVSDNVNGVYYARFGNNNIVIGENTEKVGIGTLSPVSKLHVQGDASNNSTLKVGTLEFQPYSVNNAWFGDNTYYDGGFYRREAGYAGAFYFQGAEGQFRFANTDDAGTTYTPVVQLKTHLDGRFGVGSNISTNTSDFTNSNFFVDSTDNGANVGIGTITPSEKLEVNGDIKFGQQGVQSATLYMYDSPNESYNIASWADSELSLFQTSNSSNLTISFSPQNNTLVSNGSYLILPTGKNDFIAMDAEVIHKTGDESINGLKTFTSGIDIYSGTSPQSIRVFNSTGNNSGEFGLFGWQNNNLVIGSQAINSGILRNVVITGSNININPSGNLNLSNTSTISGYNGTIAKNRSIDIKAGNGPNGGINSLGGLANINLFAGTGLDLLSANGFGGVNLYAGPSTSLTSGTHNIYGNVNINNSSSTGARTLNIYRGNGIGSSVGISIDNNNANFQNSMGLQVSGVQVTPALYVNTTTNQTINGVKTFTSGIDIYSGTNSQSIRVFNSTGTNSGEFGLFGWVTGLTSGLTTGTLTGMGSSLVFGAQNTNSGILRDLVITGSNIHLIPSTGGTINFYTGNGVIGSQIRSNGGLYFSPKSVQNGTSAVYTDTSDVLYLEAEMGAGKYIRIGKSPYYLDVQNSQLYFQTSASNFFRLVPDGSNNLTLRNGTNAQTFRVFNTTGTNSGEFGLFGWQNNNLIIGSQATNSGILRDLTLTGNNINILLSGNLNINKNTTISGNLTVTGNVNSAGNYYVKLARLSDQTISQGSDAVIQFSGVADPNNWYNSGTYRITPTVAGNYWVNVMANWKKGTVARNNQNNIQIRKGTTTIAIALAPIESGENFSVYASAIASLNGSTDYIDTTAYTSNTTSQDLVGTADGAWTKLELFKLN